MILPDMFAHKLCALTDRRITINRDIFDCWFFLKRKTPVNQKIIELRMNQSLEAYLETCISTLDRLRDRRLLNGLGDLMDEQTKQFVKSELLKETLDLLRLFQRFPMVQ